MADPIGILDDAAIAGIETTAAGNVEDPATLAELEKEEDLNG